jgi:large subunit ribosomal protein L33
MGFCYTVTVRLEVCKMRTLVKLVCTECGDENYHTTKNKKTTPNRLEMKKYCPRLRKHTLHREKK